MAGKIPNVGLLKMLNYLITQWGNTLLLKLFRNDTVPFATMTVADMVEANYSGYGPFAIVGTPAWSAPTIVGGIGVTQANPFAYFVGAGGVANAIYGYYITDSTGTILLAAERDPFPPVGMNSIGDSYTITPKITLISAT